MGSSIPPVLLTYIEGLKSHDIAKIADTMAEELKFISATRILDKQPALKMLTALHRVSGLELQIPADRGSRPGQLCSQMGSGRHAHGHLGNARHATDCADRKKSSHSRTLLLLPDRRRQTHDHFSRAFCRRGAAWNTGADRCRITSAVVRRTWWNAAPARYALGILEQIGVELPPL